MTPAEHHVARKFADAVKRLCQSLRSELDGDSPIHCTETQNALDEVEAILSVPHDQR